MKGVIVQTGHPKSIVLLNNGKIMAIPTPSGCKVGMLVTVKYNSLLKIILISLAAVILLALGIFIGATVFNRNTTDTIPSEPSTSPKGEVPRVQNEQWHRRQHGHRRMMEM